MTPKEADRFFMDEGLAFIVNNPRETIKLAFRKVLLFFNNYEIKGIDDLYYLRTQSTILALNPLGLGVLVLFAGLGIMRLIALKEQRILFLFGGLLAVMMASNVLGFVSWRYRLHNTVPLLIFAAYGFQSFKIRTLELVRSGRPFRHRLARYAYSILLPLSICGWVAYRPVLENHKKGFLKRASINDKLSRNAEKLQERLARLETGTARNPRLLIEKALLLNKLHRHSESYRILKSLHEGGTYDQPDATYKYLVYLLWLGKYDRAIDLLREVKSKRPKFIRRIERSLKGAEKGAYRVFIEPKIR